MPDPVEIPGVPPFEQKDSQEQLNRWIERGFNQEAVAVYGTTVENLEVILRSGFVPGYRGKPVDYQQELIDEGKSVYYAYPILDNIQRINPTLGENLASQLEPQFDDFEETFSTDQVTEGSKWYANRNALSEYFYDQTGIRVSADLVMHSARTLIREVYKASGIQLDVMDSEDKLYKEQTKLIRKLGRDSLAEILSKAIQRRGVLIYFNKEVLEQDFKTSLEFGDHIILVADQPLGVSTISGIEFLSEVDERAVREMEGKV